MKGTRRMYGLFWKPVQWEAISIHVVRTSSIQEIFSCLRVYKSECATVVRSVTRFQSDWSVVQNNFAKTFFVTTKTCVYDSNFGGMVLEVAFNCCAVSKTAPENNWCLRTFSILGTWFWLLLEVAEGWYAQKKAFVKRLIGISNRIAKKFWVRRIKLSIDLSQWWIDSKNDAN